MRLIQSTAGATRFDEFDFSREPGLQPAFGELRDGQFVEAGDSIVLIGGAGTGKSHFSNSFAEIAATAGKIVADAEVEHLFVRYLLVGGVVPKEIIDEDLAADRARLMVADLVVFNPMERLGNNNPLSDWLFELMLDRIDNEKSCIITATPDDIWSPLGRMHSPVGDLLARPNVRLFTLNAPSYRLYLEERHRHVIWG
jgi:DNA replication protein DnaC